MKKLFVVLIVVSSMVFAQDVAPDRGSMDFYVGGGAWMPGLTNSDNQLAVGYQIFAGAETPMSQGNQFRFSVGGGTCSSDRLHFDGITAFLLHLGYRSYPFYKPYAGARGLEPFIGVNAGGIVAWDSVADGFSSVEKSTSTGGAVLGVELGVRMKLKENSFFDITLDADWVPVGASLAGEDGQDLSDVRIMGSVVF